MIDRESEKTNQTKRSLLESARDLVAERGSDRISIQEITTRADVATGTYYNYFETKRDIFVAVALHLRSQMQEDLEPVRNKIKDPAMRVTITLRYYFDQAFNHNEWREFVSNTGLSGDITLHQPEDEALKDIEEGIKGGRFRVDDPSFTQSLILGMVKHVIEQIESRKADKGCVNYAIRSVLQMLGLPELVSQALTQTPLPPIAATKRERKKPFNETSLAPVTSISEYSSGLNSKS
jgi:AcrR family transcriptional regulator